jgi:hypothetical protein
MLLPIDEQMVQYVQGYIMAMDDVLRDIDGMQYDAEEAEPEYVAGHGAALDSLKHRAEESRESARRTLDMIVKKLDAGQ